MDIVCGNFCTLIFRSEFIAEHCTGIFFTFDNKGNDLIDTTGKIEALRTGKVENLGIVERCNSICSAKPKETIGKIGKTVSQLLDLLEVLLVSIYFLKAKNIRL